MIFAYAWPQSTVAGGRIGLHVSGDTGTVDIEVVRQGAHDEVVWRRNGVAVGDHPTPDDASTQGCGWPAAIEIESRDDMRSGFYLVRLRHGAETAQAFFVLRSAMPARHTSRLLVLSTSTWAAYNDWAGPSYYTGGFRSSLQRPLPGGFLERPEALRFRAAFLHSIPPDEGLAYLSQDISLWCIAAGWAQWERFFVAWAERHGINFDFAVSADLETIPGLLDPYDLYVSVGHDEYWSAAMRDAVEGFVARGGNAAFFSGNAAFWQIRHEDDATAQVSYKLEPERDPLFGTDRQRNVATMWSDPLAGRPENEMTGVSFTRGGYAHLPNAPGNGGYTVWRPDHWIFAGSGLGYGDLLGADPVVVGYECDGCAMNLRDGLPVPTGEDGTPADFEILATAAAHLWATDERPDALPPGAGELNWVAERLGRGDTPEERQRFAAGRAVLGCRPGDGRRGTTVTTGCTDWTFGLAAHDPAVEAITRNVLTRLAR